MVELVPSVNILTSTDCITTTINITTNEVNL